MFQIALLGQLGFTPAEGSRSASLTEWPGLESLLGVEQGLGAALSGQLQAWLAQASPEQLRQWETQLRSGMGLPQAASDLLGGQLPVGADEFFSGLLEAAEGVSTGRRLPLDTAGQVAAAKTDNRLVMPSPLPDSAADPAPESSTRLLTPIAALPSQYALSPVPGQGMAPPLAGSLLHMGVPQTVGAKAWQAAVADRVLWMVQGEQQFARLRLNPPNLGPLEVRLSVNQDQTAVSFITQHAAVREALEAAMPRLREMFEQQSLDLVRAEVAEQGQGGGEHARAADTSPWPSFGEGAGEAPEDGDVSIGPQPVHQVNLVDLFA